MIPPSTQDARATGLVELAVRCEQATGADFHLDIDIGIALDRAPDAFTASLDAAKAIVPVGWAISSMSAWPASPDEATNPTPPQASVELVGTSLERWGRKMVWGHKGSDGRVQSTAKELPLALAAAALRARALAASTKDQNDG